MIKYVMLNISSILNNVRNCLADIFFCCYKIKNIVITKEQYSVNGLFDVVHWSAALLLYMEVNENE